LRRLEETGDTFFPLRSLSQKLPQEILEALSSQARGRTVNAPALETYRRKRDFSKTTEPAPALPRSSSQGSRRRFVIQKHNASHLHYDFRLEMHGVLKSWAVPKGPPVKEDERRLAMATEDHPIEYLDFEGIIPKGQYGGGTVMVWDIGTYDLAEGNYYRGYLRFFLNGAKLKGEWTLTRLPSDERQKWQLLKTNGNTRTISRKRDDQSVLSNRTMKQIEKDADAQWNSNR